MEEANPPAGRSVTLSAADAADATDPIQLSDLLASYPDISTQRFQTLFSEKKEFNELASSITERPPQTGELYRYRHQELIKRALRAYDSLLVAAETGTGKTCSVVAFTEWVLEQYQALSEGKKTGNIRRVIVLVPGKAQKAEFRYQLVCRCAPGKYEPPKSKQRKDGEKPLDEAHQKGNVTRIIKKWYEVMTYETFANRIIREYPHPADNWKITRDYSDTVFWIDEAHNLHIDPILPDRPSKRSAKNKKPVPRVRRIYKKQVTYFQIWRVMHLIQRSKKILSTATPMINDVNDVKSLMNLILPENGKLPPNYRYQDMTSDEIRIVFPDLPRNQELPSLDEYSTMTPTELRYLFPSLPLGGSIPTLSQVREMNQDQIGILFPRLPPKDIRRITEEDITRYYVPIDISYAIEEDLAPFFRPSNYRRATPEQIAPFFRGQMENQIDLLTATMEDVRPFFQGRITFVRALDTGAIPIEQINEEVPPREDNTYEIDRVTYMSQLRLYETIMSEFQTEAYDRARSGREGKSGVQRDIYNSERQASNFVFPDGTWGTGLSEAEKQKRLHEKARRRARQHERSQILQRELYGVETEESIEESPLSLEDQMSIEEESLSPEEEIPLPQDIIPSPRSFSAEETRGTRYTTGESMVPTGRSGPSNENQAFSRYVIVQGDKYRASREFEPWLEDMEKIRQLSCKFHEVVRLVSEPDSGNAFVYSEHVFGSGLIVLALCLEAQGFERFTDTTSIFLPGEEEESKPFCARSVGQRIRPDFPRKLRYGLLVGGIPDANRDAMLEAMNSYENRHGDYIKVLLSSSVGREGINVNNVQQIHLLSPEWTQSAIYQAISRGIRSTSHVALLEEIGDELEREGKDRSLARVTVKVYKQAAVPLSDIKGDMDLDGSIDEIMYQGAEYKERQIRRVLRMMKQYAIDCWIHWGRNVRPDDIPGTPSCDYQFSNCGNECRDRWVDWARSIGAPNAEKVADSDFSNSCAYECADPLPIYEDYTTYDVLYADEIMSRVNEDVKKAFRVRSLLTIEELLAFLPQHRRKYVEMAAEHIITNKIPLIDRFGYPCYLREDRDTFYLMRSYPTETYTSRATALYNNGIIALEKRDLAEIVSDLEVNQQNSLVSELETIPPDSPKFDETIKDLNVDKRVALVENVISRQVAGEDSPFLTAIRKRFSGLIFEMHEPIRQIQEMENTTSTQPRRGRKPKEDTKKRVKRVDVEAAALSGILSDVNTDNEKVYLHTIYTSVADRTAYSSTSRFNKAEGRIRLLKPSERQGWRDLNQYEKPVYNALIQLMINQRKDVFERKGIYGFFLPTDQKFRIRNILTENPDASKDARKINRGKDCNVWKRSELIDIMWEIGAPGPNDIPSVVTASDENLIREIKRSDKEKKVEDLQNWERDRLEYYYKWHTSKITRQTICVIIKDRMEATGRLMVI